MAKKKIFTKKNCFILFLLGCLSAATVVGVVHSKDASERLVAAELSAKTTQTKVVNLERENRALKIILQIVSSQTCPQPIECAEPEVCDTCAEPVECTEPIECPAAVTCEPEIITIRVIEKEIVIEEIQVPVECTHKPTEPDRKLEGFTPYLDLEGRTDGTAGAILGLDKELVSRGRFSMRFFAELSHDVVQKDTASTSIEIDSYYCEEFQCPEIIDAQQEDRTRGNFGIRFRF